MNERKEHKAVRNAETGKKGQLHVTVKIFCMQIGLDTIYFSFIFPDFEFGWNTLALLCSPALFNLQSLLFFVNISI